MRKIDYKKELHLLYASSSTEITLVDVPALQYVMIDGKGDPNTAIEYREAVEALYTVSYTIKFMVKKGKGLINYSVLPLEGLWWVPVMEDFSTERKDAWLWKMMMMQPNLVTKGLFDDAIEAVQKKKNLSAIHKLSFETFNEGKCAQIMHFGPYRDERPTIDRLHNGISQQGYKRTGKHHEIYLNDPRKSAPEKLKTIIRQPII
ncbi:MAG: GyrI-like domain-containing protein [Bacteroidota bacterium]